jgi:hypothetical protein
VAAEELIINLAGQVTDNFRLQADPGGVVIAGVVYESPVDGRVSDTIIARA